jgi:hypothetical protein
MFKQAAIKPTVEGFILYLTGALTQYDQRSSKRRGYNPYALGHYMKAVGQIESDVAKHKKSQEPEALEALKKAIGHRFFVNDTPPAKKTIKAIDDFLATGKVPNYPVSKRTAAERVAVRFIEAHDPFMSVEEIADLCLKCAYTLMADGREGARHSELRQMLTAGEGDKWTKLPKGWTEESLKKFWQSLTGRASKHKVTSCIKQMDGKVDDPGAFCAALADRVDTGWRERD